jgi:hypothetical protein
MNSVTLVRSTLAACLVAAAFVPLACGSKPAANASFSFGADGGPSAQPTCQPGQPCPPPACGQPGQPPCAQPMCGQPGQPACTAPATTCGGAGQAACPPPQGCGQPGQAACSPLDPSVLGGLLGAASAWFGGGGPGDPSELGLRAAAAKYAVGMSPEGQVAHGNVNQGQHVTFIVNMDPSKCYTIIGYGGGFADLDVNLLAPPLYNVAAGHDETTGPTAVIGGAPHPMCPVIPIAIPYKVDIYAKSGGGPVAAQVFSKAK